MLKSQTLANQLKLVAGIPLRGEFEPCSLNVACWCFIVSHCYLSLHWNTLEYWNIGIAELVVVDDAPIAESCQGLFSTFYGFGSGVLGCASRMARMRHLKQVVLVIPCA